MDTYNRYRTELFEKLYTNVNTESGFSTLALEIFHFQYRYNPLYAKYCALLAKQPEHVKNPEDIPFLPIQLFKSNEVKTGNWRSERIFQSSSTTGTIPSKNHFRDIEVYDKNTEFCFEDLMGSLKNFKWFALLPSYLERGNSSLVHMAKYFMEMDPDSNGGFYLNEYDALLNAIKRDKSGRKKILLGVSYALLDLANSFQADLHDVIIMETGGMKGRGKELSKDELYQELRSGLNVPMIHSEYGMTELMSQAYTLQEGVFDLPKTMQVHISDLNDPFEWLGHNQQGRIHIMDLANIDTCAFLATDDMGIRLNENQFKVLGRTDASEMRGCNLLYTG